MSPDPDYSPIACSLHDRLEAIATLGRTVSIVFRDADGAVQAIEDRLVDIFARDGEEFVETGGGRLIRLDRLRSVDGVAFERGGYEIVHDPGVRAGLLGRVERLREDSPRAWGRLSPAGVLFHLNAQLRIALGELQADPVGDPSFWHTKGKAIALGDEPWPKGAPTSPEALPSEPPDFADERQRLRRLLDRFAAADLHGKWPDHPRMGPMSGRQWSRLTRNHIDHHCRQFGV